VAALFSALPAQGTVLPSGFGDSVVFSGLEEPTAVSFSPDERVFVAEKAGKIMVYDGLADGTPELFADLRTEVYDSGDRGILGLELDPGFPTSPYVYVLYTYDHMLGEADPPPKWGEPDDTGDDCPPEAGFHACPVSGRLVRLTAGGVGGNQAIAETPLLEGWCQQFSSHSIGDLQFDSEGNLYASGGDGARATTTDYGQFGWPQKNQCGDPPVPVGGDQTLPTAEGGALRSQDLRTPNPLGLAGDPTGLNGTIVRVDPETGQGVPGNPMFGSLDANERRIVGYGFRNPFRFAIDQAEDEIYVGNVGWTRWEEVDRFTVGSDGAFNSGWPCVEGPEKNVAYRNLALDLCEDLYAESGAVDPSLFAYRFGGPLFPGDPCPSENGAAITGMSLYRDSAFPAAYDGALFFADSVRGCIYVMLPGDDGKPDPTTTTIFASDAGVYPAIDIEVGPAGDLYYVKLFGDAGGEIHRISYDPDAPIAELSANPTSGAADPLEVDLDASGSSDPQGETLSYDWDLDGDGIFEIDDGGAERIDEEIDGPAPRRVVVRVSDEGGADSVAQVIVHPGNTPPVPEIEEPLDDLEWSVGEKVEFAGSAEDAEDPEVNGEDLHWSVRLLHCPGACHEHPLQVFPGVEEGSFSAPDHDYPAHLKVILTATDSQGLTATDSVEIDPQAVDLDIRSDPAGLSLGAGLKTLTTPFTLTAIVGSNVVLSAPPTQELGGGSWVWTGWSNGGDRVQNVVADQSAQYTAFYRREGAAGPDGETVVPLESRSPQTRLLRRPAKKTGKSTARFRFSADVSEATFKCKLDRRPLAPCRSPRVYRNLQPGRHRFEVVAFDALGNADPSPSRFSWRIVCAPPSEAAAAAATQRRRACARRAGSAGRGGR
jgi:glucose/arabinose dehydrogenase